MSSSNLTQRLLWLLAIIAAIVLMDQWMKLLMVDWFGPTASSHRHELLGSLFAFEYLENRGAAFGLFSQGTTVLAIASVLIIGIGLAVMVRFAIDEFWLAASVALILGGAIGNAIDRFQRGFVVDYIAIGRFWKFNLADSAVTIGVILVFLYLWRADSAADTHESIQENGA